MAAFKDSAEEDNGTYSVNRANDKMKDITNPDHYKSHPSGVECIQITEHMSFCVGNAIKYLWRAGQKGNVLDDLRKAAWYIDREIKRLSDNK